jgi:hypothetical protein
MKRSLLRSTVTRLICGGAPTGVGKCFSDNHYHPWQRGAHGVRSDEGAMTRQCNRLFVRFLGPQYAKFFSHSHGAMIRVYDDAGNVIEAHEHTGDFKET